MSLLFYVSVLCGVVISAAAATVLVAMTWVIILAIRDARARKEKEDVGNGK